MPRPGPERPAIAWRDSPELLNAIAAEARERELTFTDYMLQLVSYGRQHMPADWPSPPDRTAPKPGISFRMAPRDAEQLADEAAAAGVTRELQISRLVSFARGRMPADWPVPDHALDKRRGERFAPVTSS